MVNMSLFDYFTTNFTNNRVTFEIQTEKEYNNLDGRMHYDFNAGCRFLSFYIPITVDKEFIKFLLDGIRGVPQNSGSIRSPFIIKKRLSLPTEEHLCGDSIKFGEYEIGMKNLSESDDFFENMESLQFSGRIYFYMEAAISNEDMIDIMNYGKKFNFRIKFRTKEYAKLANTFKIPRAFISHDSKDKDSIVRNLADYLNKAWCPVWYDEYSLSPGDSLVDKINEGLKKCEFCIIILSKNFIKNKRWANAEFDSIVSQQIRNGTKKIIPIWYDVTEDEVSQFNLYICNIVGIPFDKSNPDKSMKKIHDAIK